MRNPMRTFRLVTVPVILSCTLAGGDPATAQETPPPPSNRAGGRRSPAG